MEIAALAHALPSHRMMNSELIRELIARNSNHLDAKSRDFLEQRISKYFDHIGLISRYHRTDGEKAAVFAIEAARKALKDASIKPGEIDLLIYVGVGRGWIEPAMANLFLAEIGLTNATGFDLLDACASWIRALDVAHTFVQSGKYHRVLILNCEFNFREYAEFFIPDVDNLEHLLPAFTIGEVATATIVTSDHPEKEYYSLFKTSGEHHDLCKIPLPNKEQYCVNSKQNGRHNDLRFYAYGTQLTQVTMKKALTSFRGDSRLNSFEPEICFGHSVSEPVTDQIERMMGFSHGTTFRIFAHYGNTVSASVPLAMSLAYQNGALRRGQRAMLIVGSAGISVGFVALRF